MQGLQLSIWLKDLVHRRVAENAGGCFILEIVASDYDVRVIDQIRAYSSQLGHRGIEGIILIVLDKGCLGKIRSDRAEGGYGLGDGLVTTMRSRSEKLQFESLLMKGRPMSYDHNQTSS